MAITPRGSGYQCVVYHKGERYRTQKSTRAEAEAWEAQAKASLMRGESPDMGEGKGGAPTTLEALKTLTYTLRWHGAKAEESLVRNANICIRDIGNVPPSRITTETIDSLIIKWKQEGKADGTINRRLAAISTMLRVAFDRGYISSLPTIARRKEKEGRIRFYSKEEEEKILSWFTFIDQPEMHDIVSVAIDTGMRMGELLRLEGRDVKDGKVTLWITKGGRARTLPLTTRAATILERRKETMGEGKLFTLIDTAVRHLWDRMRLKYFPGDDQAVFHALRHTFVSRLVQRGANLRKVSELAGHSTLKTTMRYAHLAPEDLENTIKLLED
jgi:integrase